MELSEKACIPCTGGVPPLTPMEIAPLAGALNNWTVVENHHLDKPFEFSDFKNALEFVKSGRSAGRRTRAPSRSLSGLGQGGRFDMDA